MKQIFTSVVFLFIYLPGFSQAHFNSNTNGDWDNPATWLLISGSSSTNYPVAGDSVIILNTHAVQVNVSSQCQSLTVKGGASLNFNIAGSGITVTNNVLITEASALNLTAGNLTITGNLTVNQASVLTQNGGVISTIGLIFITSPSAAGTTLLDVNAGLFNCVGGMTVSGTTATRIAEISIGASAVNVAGALTTITANAKIIFTGNGTLTLAGIITIPNAASFTAGNGRVIYVGIPGTNQTVSPLTYNRLVITGVGNGSKTISGPVVVTDTLTLLSDTLQLTGSGTLTLNNNATIVKTAGTLLAAPIFIGQADILYNNVLRDTTGFEMPVAANVLRNLFISNVSGVKLGADVTVNNQLSLQNGELFTDNFILNITNASGGITTDPAINRINGYVNGKINRSIGASTGVRIFPFGIGSIQGYREFKIEYTTAPTVTGILSVQHFNVMATAQSGLPLIDAAVTITTVAPYYWQADALSGLSGGIYNITLTAESTPGVTVFSTLRIIKRPTAGGNWILDGIAGANAGTNSAPVVVRNGMSNFSQFTIGGNSSNPLPLALLSFTGAAQNGEVLLKWETSNEINSAYFSIQRSNDGINFTEAGKVFAYSNAALINNYKYSEKNLAAGNYYYRLKITDNNGRFTLSNIVLVKLTKDARVFVYPVLFGTEINITGISKQPIHLFNTAGQLIKTLQQGVNNVSEVRTGLYFVVTGNATVKIVKQ